MRKLREERKKQELNGNNVTSLLPKCYRDIDIDKYIDININKE